MDYGITKRDSRFNVFESGESVGNEPSGAEIYRNLADMASQNKDEGGLGILGQIRSKSSSDEEAASRFLDSLGIKGIRVDDVPGKPNYVVFSPETMDIAKKFGIGAASTGLLSYLGGRSGYAAANESLPLGLTPSDVTRAAQSSAKLQSAETDRERQMMLLDMVTELAPITQMGGGVDTMEGYLRSQTR